MNPATHLNNTHSLNTQHLAQLSPTDSTNPTNQPTCKHTCRTLARAFFQNLQQNLSRYFCLHRDSQHQSTEAIEQNSPHPYNPPSPIPDTYFYPIDLQLPEHIEKAVDVLIEKKLIIKNEESYKTSKQKIREILINENQEFNTKENEKLLRTLQAFNKKNAIFEKTTLQKPYGLSGLRLTKKARDCLYNHLLKKYGIFFAKENNSKSFSGKDSFFENEERLFQNQPPQIKLIAFLSENFYNNQHTTPYTLEINHQNKIVHTTMSDSVGNKNISFNAIKKNIENKSFKMESIHIENNYSTYTDPENSGYITNVRQADHYSCSIDALEWIKNAARLQQKTNLSFFKILEQIEPISAELLSQRFDSKTCPNALEQIMQARKVIQHSAKKVVQPPSCLQHINQRSKSRSDNFDPNDTTLSRGKPNLRTVGEYINAHSAFYENKKYNIALNIKSIHHVLIVICELLNKDPRFSPINGNHPRNLLESPSETLK